jgi:phosphoribosylformylglycinamidine cyclo-ligase
MSSAQARGDQAYRQAGVDYAVLDEGKRRAVRAAQQTSEQLTKRGGCVIDASRGESAFVFQVHGQMLAMVLEGLGTKSIIARAVAEEGSSHFDDVAYDTVAAIINDLCCVGARPLVVSAYFATGTPDWFQHEDWHRQLIDGWFQACVDAGCTWGGGESPALSDLVDADEIELAGSAIGVIAEGHEPILGNSLGEGNEIVLVESTGLHANGASLARMVAEQLDAGYATRLPSGTSFGEALLRRSHMYSELVESILEARVPVTYMSHLTGHGFLKLMRPTHELTYRIKKLLPVPEVHKFLVEQANMSERVAFSTFNMGHGFAIYCAERSGARVVEAANKKGLNAIVAGHVESGERSIVIEPLGITYGSDELRLHPDQ